MARLKDIRMALSDVAKRVIPNANVYPCLVENVQLPAVYAEFETKRSNDVQLVMAYKRTQWDLKLYVVVRRDPDMPSEVDSLDDVVDMDNPDSIARILVDDNTLGFPDGTKVIVNGVGEHMDPVELNGIPALSTCLLLSIITPHLGD